MGAVGEDICPWCGDEDRFEVLEYWPSTREFMVDACCEMRQAEGIEALEQTSRRGRAAWFAEHTGEPVRELLTETAGGSWQLDWSPTLVMHTTKRERDRGTAPPGALLRQEIRDYIREHHRHAKATAPTFRWAYAVYNGRPIPEHLIGVATIGEPLAGVKKQAEQLGERWVEVTRMALDHDQADPGLLWNAASKIYGEAAREAKRRGFDRIITFTLEEEEGTTLRAAGWEHVGYAKERKQGRRGKNRVGTALQQRKLRWERRLSKKAKRAAAPREENPMTEKTYKGPRKLKAGDKVKIPDFMARKLRSMWRDPDAPGLVRGAGQSVAPGHALDEVGEVFTGGPDRYLVAFPSAPEGFWLDREVLDKLTKRDLAKMGNPVCRPYAGGSPRARNPPSVRKVMERVALADELARGNMIGAKEVRWARNRLKDARIAAATWSLPEEDRQLARRAVESLSAWLRERGKLRPVDVNPPTDLTKVDRATLDDVSREAFRLEREMRDIAGRYRHGTPEHSAAKRLERKLHRDIRGRIQRGAEQNTVAWNPPGDDWSKVATHMLTLRAPKTWRGDQHGFGYRAYLRAIGQGNTGQAKHLRGMAGATGDGAREAAVDLIDHYGRHGVPDVAPFRSNPGCGCGGACGCASNPPAKVGDRVELHDGSNQGTIVAEQRSPYYDGGIAYLVEWDDGFRSTVSVQPRGEGLVHPVESNPPAWIGARGDDRLRALERAAASGDYDARAMLARHHERIAPPGPPQPTTLDAAKATIYVASELGMGWNKYEVRDLKVRVGPYAQYTASLWATFIPKGKRKHRGLRQTYKPTLIVLDGWGHKLEPASPWGPSRTTSSGLVVTQGRHTGFSEEWGKEFSASLTDYLASNRKAVLLADYRGWNAHANIAPTVAPRDLGRGPGETKLRAAGLLAENPICRDYPGGSPKASELAARRKRQKAKRKTKRKRRRNPAIAVVNPGKRVSLAKAKKANAKAFKKARAKYAEFHDVDPDHAMMFQVEGEGPPLVVTQLGLVPETHYFTDDSQSNKDGAHWVHKHPGGKEPLEVWDPQTGLTMKIPTSDEMRITDWWYN